MTAPMQVAAGTDARDRLFVVALASGWAGIIHLSIIPEHLAAWWGYGAFFFAVGAAQMVSGLVLMRSATPGLVSATAAGNAIVVLVYVASRTVGVRVGPEHRGHQLESTGPIDLAATATEVLIVAALVPLLPARARHRAVDLLLVCGLGLWLLRVVGRLD